MIALGLVLVCALAIVLALIRFVRAVAAPIAHWIELDVGSPLWTQPCSSVQVAMDVG